MKIRITNNKKSQKKRKITTATTTGMQRSVNSHGNLIDKPLSG